MKKESFFRIDFRGLPCTIAPIDKIWCISGEYSDGSGGGILEWCYDKEDAKFLIEEMKKDKRFINLVAHKYKDLK